MFSGTAQIPHQVCQVFVSSECLLVRVTTVHKNKAVGCSLLATLETVGFFLSELRSSLCVRRLERTVLRPTLLPVKTAQFAQLFCQV
jgi:hypothetical protein